MSLRILNLFAFFFMSLFGFSQQNLNNIRVRDPFILPDTNSSTYYLYVQTGNRLSNNDSIKGVEVYTSKNLTSWEGPKTVFSAEDYPREDLQIWAPEVHFYRGQYYMFVTLTSHEKIDNTKQGEKQPRRWTQILKSKSPFGPFRSFGKRSATPKDWMSLDGTFWVEHDVPYMIFCHEWAQIGTGTVELVRLKDDLSSAKGNPKTLFKATDANWVERFMRKSDQTIGGYVTDGCFIYKTKKNTLLMIWSSFGKNGYALGQAASISGSIKGPWKQIEPLIFDENGGHGMIFKTFQGDLKLVLHQPNGNNLERTRIFDLEDSGNFLTLKH
ncbi:glycoside hydrolase family 43 protein [Leeuwenhoekiella parthenopeia]|uniref:Glycoside hydrolase family 43 protein n=1 Tax=Leeuwenhoekiella parthenopeia TaxID=2890320 RepID=A0ABS8GRP1_9FLAO|nr:glycoside hydrolase family 43 protein [Leeuwenhoekiella parthenopeia]MCC4211253.1 glycoside hydrolase family 43 protein [Leeuwenhoekiella parthenopeia]